MQVVNYAIEGVILITAVLYWIGISTFVGILLGIYIMRDFIFEKDSSDVDDYLKDF